MYRMHTFSIWHTHTRLCPLLLKVMKATCRLDRLHVPNLCLTVLLKLQPRISLFMPPPPESDCTIIPAATLNFLQFPECHAEWCKGGEEGFGGRKRGKMRNIPLFFSELKKESFVHKHHSGLDTEIGLGWFALLLSLFLFVLVLSLKLLLLLPGCDNQIMCEIIQILCPHAGQDPSRCLSVCIGICGIQTHFWEEKKRVAFWDRNN